MSFQAMTWAVNQELPAHPKLVLLMLANCTNHHTGQCNPSHDRLAKECGMSKDSVKRAIADLAERGKLEVRRQVRDGVNLPNQYVLKVGAILGGVDADSTEVGAHSTEGRGTQHGGVGADSTTKQEVKTRKETTPSAGAFQLPDWIRSDLWKDFEELRRKKKKPLTDRARQTAVNKLAKLREAGQDIEACIEQTVLHAWDTFYPVAANGDGNRKGDQFGRAGIPAGEYCNPGDARYVN
jgi:biotin operon repressor